MSMITATTWVPRGHAAAFPTKYVFDEDEYARISKLAKLELDDAKDDLENARQAMSKVNGSSDQSKAAEKMETEDDEESEDADGGGVDIDGESNGDDDLKEYDMEHYDDEPEDGDSESAEQGPNDSIFGNIKGLAYYTDNKDDPYITLPEKGEQSDDEEREELQIMPTDNLVLAARIEDEVAHLETYVYEDSADNLYVHHDVMLPAVPLCVEWVGTRPNKQNMRGNFAAVGTMDPDIELWDLDVVDGMYPTAILGQASQAVKDPTDGPVTKKKKSKKGGRKVNSAYHVDSVLSLAANRTHSNLLASASADNTIKLWDLNTCSAVQSYSHHTDKVCTLAWHPTQTSVLLSGSYDRTIAATDMRAPDTAGPKWSVGSDVEQVRWDPHDEHLFYASTEDGMLHCFDARQAPSTPKQSKAQWTLQAHDKPLSTFALNPAVPGFLATGSTDRTTKIWNVTSSGPSMVTSRDLGVGKVFSTNFAPDTEVAFRLAVAGSKGNVQIWDTSTNKAVREAFAGRVKMPYSQREEKLVGLQRDDENDDDDGEDEVEENGNANGGDEGGWESMDEE